jgi:Arc/MetJ-type ribon-helix-helix transcriptional regulator
MDAAVPAGHTAGMTTTQKIAVSLPKHVAEGARRAVRSGRAKSVSAYVADALEEKVKLDDLSLLLDEMLTASGGPLTPAERREADRALGVSKQAPRRRRAQ